MICEIIQKPGEKGSGGGRDAFVPGVHYVCGKATTIRMRNIASSNWIHAAEEMLLTSGLSDRVRKPYYHLVLTWHEHEQPTDTQMLAAIDHLIHTLGLEEHQVVIGTHRDGPRKHIHAVANTVHPITGKTWSKSNDHQKVEAACRQIELDQGWSHDRGRFAFDRVVKDGRLIAVLKPDPEAWEAKTQARKEGRRRKTSGDIRFEKSTGFETFAHGIPEPLRQKIGDTLRDASNWQDLHRRLGVLGLTYFSYGSGARIGILGSDEYAKASAFGSAFSLAKMTTRFGPYAGPDISGSPAPHPEHVEAVTLTGKTSPEDGKAARASAFKLTLLRRTYTAIHVDPAVTAAIRFVDLAGTPPRITYHDGASVVDHGDRLSASHSTPETRATMIAMAKAKGWSSGRPSGSPGFVRQMALDCARAGLPVHGVPEDVQRQADALLAETRAKERQIDAAVRAAQSAHLGAQVDREEGVAANAAISRLNADMRAEREATIAGQVDEITEGARAVMDAIGFARDPVSSIFRKAVQRNRDSEIAALRRATPVADPPVALTPQPAPDAARGDSAGRRRIAQQLRDNDRDRHRDEMAEMAELEAMKQLDIGTIATRGGWADVSRTHPDSTDRDGKTYRIYRRGGDTIKARLDGGKWLWTSNKTGQAGSVVDLWLHDNPGRSLGHARVAFRALAGTGPVALPSAAPAPAPPRVRQSDHTAARQRWEEAPHAGTRRTYAEDRGIAPATVLRFPDEVRCGAFGGIYFAHRNPDTGNIQGFEQRWKQDGAKNRARFARGGRKTLCVLGDPATATDMVVVESGLDALALAELDDCDDRLYVSTGGGFGALTEKALMMLAQGRTIFSAFDNDAGGEALARRLRTLLPGVERLSPPTSVDGAEAVCKDWLDVLNAWKAAGMVMPSRGEPSQAEPVAVKVVAEDPQPEPPGEEDQGVEEYDRPEFM